jgi:hypothetical protein
MVGWVVGGVPCFDSHLGIIAATRAAILPRKIPVHVHPVAHAPPAVVLGLLQVSAGKQCEAWDTVSRLVGNPWGGGKADVPQPSAHSFY